MARFGFCAGTYQSTSTNTDAQRCQNWYPEVVESGDGASAIALYPTPGLKRFAQLPGSRVRGMYEYNGRVFAVTDRFYEVFANGTFTAYDLIPDDGEPVTMAANNVGQLVICGGSQLWLFPLVQPAVNASLLSVQGIQPGITNAPGRIPTPATLAVTCGTTSITATAPIASVTGATNPNTLAVTCGTMLPGASSNIFSVQTIPGPSGGSGPTVNPPSLAVTCGGTTSVGQTAPIAVVQGTPNPNTLAITCGTVVPGTSAPVALVEGIRNLHGPNSIAVTLGTLVVQASAQIVDVTASAVPYPGGVNYYLTVNLTSMPFVFGQTVFFQGLTNATWLNGKFGDIDYLYGNQVRFSVGSWTSSVPASYGPTADTGTAQLLVGTQMPFTVGQTVTFSGLGVASWLNGYDAYVSSIAGNTFYSSSGGWELNPSAPVFPYGPLAEFQGTAALPSVMNGVMPFNVGDVVTLSGLTQAPWFNGLTAIVSSISGSTFYSLTGSWLGQMAGTGGVLQFPQGPYAETGTAQTQFISGVMPFSVGQTVSFAGLTSATWLNGYDAVIGSIVGNTFYASSRSGTWGSSPNVPVPYGPTPDTGTATLPGVISGPMPFAVGQTILLVGLTTATWFNNLTAIISAIVGNTFYSQSGSWTSQMAGSGGVAQFPYGPAPDTGTAEAETISTSMPFSVGQVVYFSGLSNASWLNGMSATVFSISGSTFYSRKGSWVSSPYTPAFPYGPTPEPSTALAATAYTQQITNGLVGTPLMVDFVDGYFVLLLANSPQFQTSGLEDGLNWDPSFVYQTNEYTGNAVSMISNLRELWIFGAKKALPYYDSGDPLTPMQPIPGAFVEHGINARWSAGRLDNSVFWLGSDERGRNVAWRSQGYTPVRVSTHGVEAIWQTYPTLSDAIAYTTSKVGHGWWHLYFPSANASWRYDTATGMWHEPLFLSPNGAQIAHRSRIHCYAFEKNLVGDISTGTIYELTEDALTDDTPDLPQNPVRRVRRATHVINEHDFMFHHKMRVLMETGVGPTPPLTGEAKGIGQMGFLDANGNYWQANITALGIWESANYASITQVPLTNVRLVDLAYLPYQTVVYALGVDTNGGPLLTLLRPPDSLSGYIRRLPLITFPSSGLQTSLSVISGKLQIDPPQPAVREPQLTLSWSDDGGHTWSNEYLCGAGMSGDFRRRVEWRNLGRSRDRIYQLAATDPVLYRIVDAYLDITDPVGQGYKPQQRYAHQIGKML